MQLEKLTTEARNPASAEIDRLSALEIVQLMNGEDAGIPAAVAQCAPAIAEAIDRIADALRSGGRLIYIGAGTSGRLGVLDASECPPTFNSPPWQVVGVIAGGQTALTRAVEGTEDHPELAVEDLKRLEVSKEDILVGIATSGRTPYVIGGLSYMKELGGLTIGLACNAESELVAVSKLMITPVVGPEVISGSTRLKSGTATKLVLNMLTTGTMVRLGKTYGNLMVDLQTTNAKLTDRSQRIVSTLAGVSNEEASKLLSKCHGDVKTAIVMHRCSVDEVEARRRIATARGQLRAALTTSVEAARDTGIAASEPGVGRRLVLGIDGGGSKTLVWLVDASSAETAEHPLGAGEAGPSNPISIGWAAAMGNIERAVGRAFRAAGIERATAGIVCLAHAGLGREPERSKMQSWAEQRLIAQRVIVTHDAAALLAAGTPQGQGIAVVSGTGSMAYGRTSDGRTARAGGWGYLLGDEGSGFAIAVEGLRACSRAVDGRSEPTMLVQLFREGLRVAAPTDLVRAFYAIADDRTHVAALSRLVFEAAARGDSVADGIVSTAARQLATLVDSVATQLGIKASKFPLAIAGGVVIGSEELRSRLLANLRSLGLSSDPIRLVPHPVVGAVRIALGEVAV
jgi:N-acetylmuramic acid 6-phosphate etherase